MFPHSTTFKKVFRTVTRTHKKTLETPYSPRVIYLAAILFYLRSSGHRAFSLPLSYCTE